MGITQSNQNLGLECSGVIKRTSANASHKFDIGDRVLCWSPGSLSTHAIVDTDYCVKIPDSLSFKEAATMPTAYATILRALQELCNLEKGECMLVQSAGGTETIAALQIAQAIDAEV